MKRTLFAILLCLCVLVGVGCGTPDVESSSEQPEVVTFPIIPLPELSATGSGMESTPSPETPLLPTESSVGTINIATVSGSITGAENIEIPRPLPNERRLSAEGYLSPDKTGKENARGFANMLGKIKSSYNSTTPITKIDIPTGVYRLYPTNARVIDLYGFSNLIIEGNGSLFIFEESEKPLFSAAFFRIENCDTVEIRNLAVDFDWNAYPLYVIGEVISADPNTSSVTFRIDSHTLPDRVSIGGGRSWDPEIDNRSDTVGFVAYHSVKSTEVLDEHTLRVTYTAPKSAQNAKKGQQFQFYFKPNFNATGFDIFYSKNITLDGITIYSTPYEAAWCAATDGYHVTNCKIIPAEGRRFSTYTGFETHAVKGNVIFENCEFYGILDDNIHISNHFMGGENVKVDDHTVEMRHLQTWSTKYYFEEGHLLGLYDENYQPVGWSSAVTSVSSVKEPTNDMATYTVTFRDPLPDALPKNCKFFPDEYRDGSFIIRNNSFGGGLCHALYIGLGNGTIENNTFDNFAYPSLVLTTVTRWERWHIGVGVENVVIRGNTMTRCNTAGRDPASLAIVAGVDKQPTDFYPVDGYVIRNVLVENNVVDGSTASAFALFSAEDVIVRNNQFLNSNTLPTTKARRIGWGNAYVSNARNITWENNLIFNDDFSYEHFYENGLYVNEDTVEGFVYKD